MFKTLKKYSFKNKHQIEKYSFSIFRCSIQGGISNEKYPINLLYDSRLTHHIPTEKICFWKYFESAGNDSKFSDIKSRIRPHIKAEGKCLNKKRGVVLKPSIDTGGSRRFSLKNLKKCLFQNRYYFIYETVCHDSVYLYFNVYWIASCVLTKWYIMSGSNGCISYKKFHNHLSESEICTISESQICFK